PPHRETPPWPRARKSRNRFPVAVRASSARLRRMFQTDPAKMSPRMRRIALFAAQIASVNPRLMCAGFIIAGFVLIFYEVGNFETANARHGVAVLFFLLAVVVLAIGVVAKARIRKIQRLTAASSPE